MVRETQGGRRGIISEEKERIYAAPRGRFFSLQFTDWVATESGYSIWVQNLDSFRSKSHAINQCSTHLPGRSFGLQFDNMKGSPGEKTGPPHGLYFPPSHNHKNHLLHRLMKQSVMYLNGKMEPTASHSISKETESHTLMKAESDEEILSPHSSPSALSSTLGCPRLSWKWYTFQLRLDPTKELSVLPWRPWNLFVF